MGLDTTHDCWHGPYSLFNRFRFSLAFQIGINLNDYKGYNENGTKDLESIEHDLMPLFNHSDCDGLLTVKESERIIKGLNNVLENFNHKIESDYNFKDSIIRFRNGCIDAVSKKQEIEFR